MVCAIKGFKDILPAEAAVWRRLEDTARDMARRHNLQEIRVPIAEKTEVFARGLGEATDVVEKEMYSFIDKGEERLTLRPEATAGIMRAAIEHNLAAPGAPARLFFMGPMFRYERPQKGRQRQFHQIDVEVIGDPGPCVDAEMLLWLSEFLRALGLSEPTINLNSLGCPQCRPAYRQKLVEFFEARQEGLCPDCRRRLRLNPLRIIDCKNPRCQETVAGAPQTLDHLCPDCAAHFAKVRELLALAGLKYEVNPRLVRGLDYYTRTAFEVLSNDLGAQAAVAGGGRYDGLCEELGGPSLPAIGFAMGMERLALLLAGQEAAGPQGPDYYVAPLCDEALPAAFKLTQKLRAAGHAVAGEWAVGSLKSRLKRADKTGAAQAVIIGPDELRSGQAMVRDMASHEQTTMPIEGDI